MAVRSQRLPRLVAGPTAADGELLTRFVESADAEAFAELVRRHAGMVRGVCRRVLGDSPDADDAFQATFLVFVRKARSVSPRSQVGNFLYGVAHRTAVYARTTRARRSARLRELPDMPATHPESVDPDQLAVLDDELTKLPDLYRTAVVLCELEGLSLKDAAVRVKVPTGTLASRLARGRKLLADRLTKRGLGCLLLALGGAGATSAAVPRKLLEQVSAGAGKNAPASELAHGVLKAMLMTKLKTLGKVAVGVLVFAGLLATVGTGTAAPEPRPTTKAPVPATTTDAEKELARLFDDLDDCDADKAVKAAVGLATSKGTVAFLKKQIKPVELDDKALDGWVADLTGGDEEKQKSAAKALEPLSTYKLVMARLVSAMKGTTDQDVRRRVAVIIFSTWDESYTTAIGPNTRIEFTKRNPPLSRGVNLGSLVNGGGLGLIDIPDEDTSKALIVRPGKAVRQRTRAVVILERIGTPDAVAVLKDLATGHADAEPTVEAKAALERLKK